MYSDNFVNYPFEKMRQFHIKEKKPLTLFLSKKNKGNLKLSKDLKILKYDKLRGKSNFNYVEIGYMFASKKKLFSYISDRNIDFSDSFEDIIKDNNLNALISCEKYYSISDQARLKKTKKFFSKKKIILLDRDGIINKKKSKGNYVTKWSEFKLLKDNIDGLTKLSKNKFKFIIITNQAGVGRKKMSIKKLNFINENLKKY